MSDSQSTTDLDAQIEKLEENERAQEEIKRATAELQARQNASKSASTRDSLPKDF